ncbi:twin-arginine translocation signal domain-containing protein [Chromobacterium phragmitis]|uniref:twin-arginine translocation signal domain-containing protein n=1 Tax=Chromobacterium phragmitis TaxID=2202141 RepID=UPI003878262A
MLMIILITCNKIAERYRMQRKHAMPLSHATRRGALRLAAAAGLAALLTACESPPNPTARSPPRPAGRARWTRPRAR